MVDTDGPLLSFVADAAELTRSLESAFSGILLDDSFHKQTRGLLGMNKKWVPRRFLLTPTSMAYFDGKERRALIRLEALGTLVGAILTESASSVQWKQPVTVSLSGSQMIG